MAVTCTNTLNFVENNIDGEAFLELTETEVKSLVSKLGTAKKILRLQASMVHLYLKHFTLAVVTLILILHPGE